MLRLINCRANSKRELLVVTQLDLEELKRVQLKRAKLNQLNKDNPTLNLIKKELYFQYIFNIYATEGAGMSLVEIQKIVETKLVIPGKLITEHNEILSIDFALRYLIQTLVKSNSDIQVKDILEIHRRVTGYVDPIDAGTFRKTEVFIGDHLPPAASDIEFLIDKFVKTLKSSTVKSMHPIHIAAFAHHKLMFIYPFIYGNGKTARLLMNLILMKHGYPPIIIKNEEIPQYYRLLNATYENNLQPFYRFIVRATEHAIDMFLHALGNVNNQD